MSRINYDLSKIRAFVFDVDGVLSPSTIPMSENGEPMRMVNIKDGYALQYAVKKGYQISIITGAKTDSIYKRYESLGIKDIYLGASVKINILKEWLIEHKLNRSEVIYMGDDVPDIQCMQFVGLSCAPADASVDVLNIANYISRQNGGRGCVRDVIEQVLRSQGNWMDDNTAFGW